MVRQDDAPPIELDTLSPASPSPAPGSLNRLSSANPFDTPSSSSCFAKAPSSPFLAQELPPVDGGRGAWTFVVAAFILETVIWGYSFAFATILVYLQRTDPWRSNSLAVLSAIGAVNLGVQYLLPCASFPHPFGREGAPRRVSFVNRQTTVKRPSVASSTVKRRPSSGAAR